MIRSIKPDIFMRSVVIMRVSLILNVVMLSVAVLINWWNLMDKVPLKSSLDWQPDSKQKSVACTIKNMTIIMSEACTIYNFSLGALLQTLGA